MKADSAAADGVADNVAEEQGFIGRFSQKMAAKQAVQQKAAEDEEDALAPSRPEIPLSKNAPGHKGMLARAMESDAKDEEARDAAEKEALIDAAMNDPAFKIQMTALQNQLVAELANA